MRGIRAPDLSRVRAAIACLYRRIFQQDFGRAFGAADEVVVTAVLLPAGIGRLSAEQLMDDLRGGQRARHIRGHHRRDRARAPRWRYRVLMSNGGFGAFTEARALAS